MEELGGNEGSEGGEAVTRTRLVRVLTYDGPSDQIDEMLNKRWVNGIIEVGDTVMMETIATRLTYEEPDICERKEDQAAVSDEIPEEC